MAEYVLVMLANSKSKEQIDAELSELVGTDYNVDFTNWLWQEAERIVNGTDSASNSSLPAGTSISAAASAPPPQEDSRRSSSPAQRRREGRSASPPARTNTYATSEAGQSRSDTRNRRGNEREQYRGRYADAHRPERPPRELFASAVSSSTSGSGRMAMDDEVVSQPSKFAMDDTESQKNRRDAQQISIRGRAPPAAPEAERQTRGSRRELFGPPSSLTNGADNSLSLLARAGVPDPRAAAFTPSSPLPPVTNSLFARMDPMMPNNPSTMAPPSIAEATSTDFPTQPTQTSLCRYSISCTNPVCLYSHPSPSAAIAKRKGSIKEGQEPIITSESPCRYQSECTNVECAFSHISPAVHFIKSKTANAASSNGFGSNTATQSTPCRFAEQCSNPSCAYAHFDAEGKPAPSPALARLLNKPAPASTSTNHQADGEDDVEFEIAATPDQPHPPSELGPDGKPTALDRPLGGAGGGAGDQGGVKPCKFGSGCMRADCWFSHPEWRKPDATTQSTSGSTETSLSTPAATNGRLHVSDRLSRFNRDGDGNGGGEEVESIIPAA